MKIYLSPSNQYANLYCVGNTTEKVQMERVAQRIQENLKKYDCEVLMCNNTLGINDKCQEAINAKCDAYISIHSNAAASTTATGTVAFYHPDSEASKEIATYAVEELNLICPVKSNRSKNVFNGMTEFNGGSLCEIREPALNGMITGYIETNFHTNPLTAQWIIDHPDDIGDKLTIVLVDALALLKKNPVLNRVWIGPYSDYKKFKSDVILLTGLGIKTMTVDRTFEEIISQYPKNENPAYYIERGEKDGAALYIQCGAYSTKSRAETKMYDLIELGFNAFVINN